MIARAHDLDPGLPWNQEPVSDAAQVARFLGWLTRDRRIRLGKRMLDKCLESESSGEPRYFTHYQKSRGTVSVFVATGQDREERVKLLQYLATTAHVFTTAPRWRLGSPPMRAFRVALTTSLSIGGS